MQTYIIVSLPEPIWKIRWARNKIAGQHLAAISIMVNKAINKARPAYSTGLASFRRGTKIKWGLGLSEKIQFLSLKGQLISKIRMSYTDNLLDASSHFISF